MDAKVFKVDNVSVSVFGKEIEGIVEFSPPIAANREKSPVETVAGTVGYSSKIVSGETTFKITTLSSSYDYLCSIVDSMEIGTVVFSMPGAIYTMINSVISKVETDSVSNEAPSATITVLYSRAKTKRTGYE